MDFITSLLGTSRNHDSIIVLFDKLTKAVHFILVKITYLASEVAQVFVKDIMRLHGVLEKIVSDKDAKYTSKFWKQMFAGLGVDLAFTITYHM